MIKHNGQVGQQYAQTRMAADATWRAMTAEQRGAACRAAGGFYDPYGERCIENNPPQTPWLDRPGCYQPGDLLIATQDGTIYEKCGHCPMAQWTVVENPYQYDWANARAPNGAVVAVADWLQIVFGGPMSGPMPPPSREFPAGTVVAAQVKQAVCLPPAQPGVSGQPFGVGAVELLPSLILDTKQFCFKAGQRVFLRENGDFFLEDSQRSQALHNVWTFDWSRAADPVLGGQNPITDWNGFASMETLPPQSPTDFKYMVTIHRAFCVPVREQRFLLVDQLAGQPFGIGAHGGGGFRGGFRGGFPGGIFPGGFDGGRSTFFFPGTQRFFFNQYTYPQLVQSPQSPADCTVAGYYVRPEGWVWQLADGRTLRGSDLLDVMPNGTAASLPYFVSCSYVTQVGDTWQSLATLYGMLPPIGAAAPAPPGALSIPADLLPPGMVIPATPEQCARALELIRRCSYTWRSAYPQRPLITIPGVSLVRFPSFGGGGGRFLFGTGAQPAAAPSGMLGYGGTCTPAATPPVDAVKPYLYVVQPGDGMYQIASQFGHTSTLPSAPNGWSRLRTANLGDYETRRLTSDASDLTCVLAINPGDKLKIPADWPDPSPGSVTSTRLACPSGQKYSGGACVLIPGPGPGPGPGPVSCGPESYPSGSGGTGPCLPPPFPVPVPSGCPGGLIEQGGLCVAPAGPITCKPPSVLKDGKCVTTAMQASAGGGGGSGFGILLALAAAAAIAIAVIGGGGSEQKPASGRMGGSGGGRMPPPRMTGAAAGGKRRNPFDGLDPNPYDMAALALYQPTGPYKHLLETDRHYRRNPMYRHQLETDRHYRRNPSGTSSTRPMRGRRSPRST